MLTFSTDRNLVNAPSCTVCILDWLLLPNSVAGFAIFYCACYTSLDFPMPLVVTIYLRSAPIAIWYLYDQNNYRKGFAVTTAPCSFFIYKACMCFFGPAVPVLACVCVHVFTCLRARVWKRRACVCASTITYVRVSACLGVSKWVACLYGRVRPCVCARFACTHQAYSWFWVLPFYLRFIFHVSSVPLHSVLILDVQQRLRAAWRPEAFCPQYFCAPPLPHHDIEVSFRKPKSERGCEICMPNALSF